MKNYILPFLLLVSATCFAQKEYDNWYFGDGVGITFLSGVPVNVSGGALNTTEGCASISDSAGNLLFYTDGTYVYGANNAMMANGNGLDGDPSSSQSSIVVPDPANSKLYYVFTVTDVGGPNGFRYSKVDMTLNGGLGDVTIKNILLQTPVDEKLTAIKRPGGAGYWVLVHGLGSSSTSFYAYPVTAAGVGSPVISATGVLNTGAAPWTGCMKLSPDGTKVAEAMYAYHGVLIADFNINTGVVSNGFVYNAGAANYMYGIEFSQTGNYLYAGTVDYAPGNVFQLNMRAGSQAAILASATLVGTTSYITGSLQMAPDGKIYWAFYSTHSLGVINKPDSAGALCNYLAGGHGTNNTVELGLPNYVSGPLQNNIAPPVADFQTTVTTHCTDDCISFTNLSTNATSYLWTFPGGTPSTSTDQNPSFVCYFDSGSYDVTLVASNSGGSDSVTFSNYISIASSPPTPVITQVNDSMLYCSTDTSYSSYQWYLDTTQIPGATDTVLIIYTGGNYNIQVSNANGCKIAVGINIILGINSLGATKTNDNGIVFYPNPAKNELDIITEVVNIKEVDIYNVFGVKIYSYRAETISVPDRQKTVIDISSLAQGIYFVQVTADKQRVEGKFVKE